MLNNFSPEPLKNEPLLKKTEPLNVEPLAVEVTKYPLLGETDAVTLPLAMNEDNNASSVSAERGISKNNLPDELMNEPLAIKILPLKMEPLSIEVTTNPSLGSTDAVIEPLAINEERSASSVRAERGISKNSLPD